MSFGSVNIFEIPVRQKGMIIEQVLIGMRVDDHYKSFAI